jgi:hypothetical protein
MPRRRLDSRLVQCHVRRQQPSVLCCPFWAYAHCAAACHQQASTPGTSITMYSTYQNSTRVYRRLGRRRTRSTVFFTQGRYRQRCRVVTLGTGRRSPVKTLYRPAAVFVVTCQEGQQRPLGSCWGFLHPRCDAAVAGRGRAVHDSWNVAPRGLACVAAQLGFHRPVGAPRPWSVASAGTTSYHYQSAVVCGRTEQREHCPWMMMRGTMDHGREGQGKVGLGRERRGEADRRRVLLPAART